MNATIDTAATPRHPLDQATTLVWRGDRWIGHTSRDYWAFIGPFGGATAAVLLRAALDHADRIGDPLALTVNYCAPIAEGEIQIVARAVKTNRSTQHWTMELFQTDGDILATATAVFAKRRPGMTHEVARPPEAPPPAEVTRYPGPPMSWIAQYDMRFVGNQPVFCTAPLAEPQSSESVVWLRDAVARPLDALSLVSMSDAFFGRIFHVLGVLVPLGTVSLTSYFHCGADEIPTGDGWVLGRADAKVFRSGFGDQHAELWSQDGRLLVSSVQTTYFRDWEAK